MPRRVRARRPRRRAPRAARRLRGKRTTHKTQVARITETIEIQNVTPNKLIKSQFHLGQFKRASLLANNFKWYKATKVTWKLEPQFNVYQYGATNPGAPYVYTVMNRTQDQGLNVNLNDLLAMGAKPRKLTGMKSTSYRPNWCSPGLLSQNVVPISTFGGALNNVFVNGLKAEYGWLMAPNDSSNLTVGPTYGLYKPIMPVGPTSTVGNTEVQIAPAAAVYNGHYFYINQVNSPSSYILCKLSCTVQWVFKDPKLTIANSTDNIFSYDLSGNEQPSEIITLQGE